jgi:drug/metabolite transporter (DMT)-like permease
LPPVHPQRTLPRSGFVWAVLSGVTWGADGVILGVAFTMAPFVGGVATVVPFVMAALHDGLTTGWMLAFNAATGRLKTLPRNLATRPGLVLCAAAVIGGPMAMSGYLFGIKLAGAAYTMAISATYPAVGAVLSRIFLRETVTRRGWAGVALTVIGAIVVSYAPPSGDAPYFYLGIALAVVATLGWGIEGVLAIHSMQAIEPVVAGTLRMATSFVVYLVVVLPLAGGLGLFAEAFAHQSIWVVLGAAAAGAAAYLTYYAANHLIGASRAMPLNSLYAAWAIVFGVIFTGLHPTPQLIAGVAITLVGAIAVVSSAPRTPEGELDEAEAIFPPAAH